MNKPFIIISIEQYLTKAISLFTIKKVKDKMILNLRKNLIEQVETKGKVVLK
jgi:hypothetical protein